MKKITSSSNPEIRRIRLLRSKSKFRKEEGAFVVEGRREFERALKNGFHLEQKYRDPSLLKEDDPWYKIYEQQSLSDVVLSSKVFEQLTFRGRTEGVIGVFREKKFDLGDLRVSKKAFFVVLDGIEKPGNIGAIFRTADAAGVDGIFISNYDGDIFNPFSIRASLGCVFSVPFVQSNPNEIIEFLKKNKFAGYLALPGDHPSIFQLDLSSSSALIFGAEDKGISKEYLNEGMTPFNIPMAGIADSLNVSVSVGISLYEAVRQRT